MSTLDTLLEQGLGLRQPILRKHNYLLELNINPAVGVRNFLIGAGLVAFGVLTKNKGSDVALIGGSCVAALYAYDVCQYVGRYLRR